MWVLVSWMCDYTMQPSSYTSHYIYVDNSSICYLGYYYWFFWSDRTVVLMSYCPSASPWKQSARKTLHCSIHILQVIDKHRLDDVSRAHLFQEVRCMKLVQHPNVVRLYEVIDTQTKLYLVLELGDGGDLYDYIMKHERGLNEQEASYYFSQVLMWYNNVFCFMLCI